MSPTPSDPVGAGAGPAARWLRRVERFDRGGTLPEVVRRDTGREQSAVADGGERTVHHVVCRDCTGLDGIYESRLQAGVDVDKHVLTTGHRVVVEEIAAE